LLPNETGGISRQEQLLEEVLHWSVAGYGFGVGLLEDEVARVGALVGVAAALVVTLVGVETTLAGALVGEGEVFCAETVVVALGRRVGVTVGVGLSGSLITV
jgi:hypothetical protein